MDPTSPTPAEENPLLAGWTGPCGGVPAFHRMELSRLEPALESAMARELEEVRRIAGDPAPPTFENTIVALERAGRDLDRVMVYWEVWSNNRSSPEFRRIRERLAPRLAAHRSRVIQHRELHARVRAVREGGEMESLRPSQRRLVELIDDEFVRHGATLEGADRERWAEISARLAELQARFSDNLLADEERSVHFLSGRELDGLPPSFVRAAAAAAAERGRPGEFAVLNTRSAVVPFLTFSSRRDLRERVWRAFTARGEGEGDRDNPALVAEILRLRHERSALLGYDSYAAWRLGDRMAKRPERALELMERVWPEALARVREEVAEMQALADAEGAGIAVRPWDYRYWAERVRRAKYDLDSDEVRRYLQLDRLREAMFFVAGELFGFRFTPLEVRPPEAAPATAEAVPVHHPDVRVWEVRREGSGERVGLWYLDPWARPGKRSGAWATAYREHESFDGGRLALVANCANFVPTPPGDPVLISWSDATTLFHEFGHALHCLSSRVEYPTLARGVRDYTELQSQLFERWLTTPEVRRRFLVHHETGEPMPAELAARIERAERFNQGFATTELLASALVDMKLHTAEPAGLDPAAFERATLEALGMPGELVMRHRTPQFAHVFASEGYAAGYYSYLWADVLTADAAEAFAEAPGGFYDRDVAARLVEHLFAPRNEVDPAEAYRAFRGRDARVEALLRHRGLAPGG